MNLYILVEGETTELQLYPTWLSYLIPNLKRVPSFNAVTTNSYYIFSGQGIPSIYNHAVNAIKDINQIKKYDYFIVALDTEEITPAKRKEIVIEHIKKSGIGLNENCKLEIITHNKCIETWFLGNRKVYKRNPVGERFKTYAKHYNVEINDPESMYKMDGFSQTAHFHHSYLREMLKEYNIRYRKSRPKEVLEQSYSNELIKRVDELPEQLNSFSDCINLFERIRLEMIG